MACGSGLSYFGNIGPTWDVAVQAAESDSQATHHPAPAHPDLAGQARAIFRRPDRALHHQHLQLQHGYGNGSPSYSQLSVGVELDVTPFINPDGLVVMDIQQEIDDISGYTTIDGNQVPNTDQAHAEQPRSPCGTATPSCWAALSSTEKSTSRSGVPFLQDIPLLGNLFSQRSDTKQREELMVLMRPTVLKTPELAAKTPSRKNACCRVFPPPTPRTPPERQQID